MPPFASRPAHLTSRWTTEGGARFHPYGPGARAALAKNRKGEGSGRCRPAGDLGQLILDGLAHGGARRAAREAGSRPLPVHQVHDHWHRAELQKSGDRDAVGSLSPFDEAAVATNADGDLFAGRALWPRAIAVGPDPTAQVENVL